MPYEFLTYKEKKILYVDFRGYSDDNERIKLMQKVAEAVANSTEELLTLDDFRGVPLSMEFLNQAKIVGKEVSSKRKKAAILGISGLRKIFLDAYNLFAGDKMMPFKTKEEALDYLASDD